MPIRCYRVKIETPYTIMQNVEVVWAGLSKEMFLERKESEWEAFGKEHNVKVKLDVNEIDCKEIKKIRSFIKQRKKV